MSKNVHIFLFSIIIFALYIICVGNTNKEIIINVMLSTQSHGANATISSELHEASLCLANVVSGPWNIPSTQTVLSIASAKRYLQAILSVYCDKLASVLGQFMN